MFWSSAFKNHRSRPQRKKYKQNEGRKNYYGDLPAKKKNKKYLNKIFNSNYCSFFLQVVQVDLMYGILQQYFSTMVAVNQR